MRTLSLGVVLLSVVVPAAFQARAKDEGHDKKFSATMTEHLIFVPTATPGIFTITIHGEGTAHSFGQVTLLVEGTANFFTGEGGGTITFFTHKGSLTGDSHIQFVPQADGTLQVIGSWDFTSGTGHLEDVVGSGTVEAVADQATGISHSQYEGVLTYEDNGHGHD